MSTERDLRGLAAVVTGAGRGIGRAVALRLASCGVCVVAADIDASMAEATAEAVRDGGGSAHGVVADVTDPADRRRLAEAATGAFGGLHILVNCAGVITGQKPLQVDPPSWRRVFEVNTEAVFFCCQAVLPVMVEQGFGRIVNLSSIAAVRGNEAMIAYNASKAAVVAITRNLASAFAAQGITVNCVLPGVIDTPMWAQLDREVGPLLGYQSGAMLADRVAQIPLGRAGTPEDVAGVVAFLVSTDAAYMTGQAINVTGGLLMA